VQHGQDAALGRSALQAPNRARSFGSSRNRKPARPLTSRLSEARAQNASGDGNGAGALPRRAFTHARWANRYQ
jgi:hypothetical protein